MIKCDTQRFENYANYVYTEDLVVSAEWNNCRVL